MKDKNDTTQMITWLFETHALRVCDPDEPFWYTSGTMGPYYINTHFLYGSEKAATDLLQTIEQTVSAPAEKLPQLAAQINQQMDQVLIFNQLMLAMKKLADSKQADFISGGERRDLFFSLPAAGLLALPHLTILKDGSTWYQPDINSPAIPGEQVALQGKKALHIADLVTEASSYVRAWLPAIRGLGADITETLVVIDRGQGGDQILAENSVALEAMVLIDQDFLDEAEQAGQIDGRQKAFILSFMADPHQFMVEFLKTHPGYLRRQIALGGKNKERAERCLALGYQDVAES